MKSLKKYLVILSIITFLIPAILTGQSMMKSSHSSAKKKLDRIGKVIETMNSGGYTYVHLEENGKKFWGAGKVFKIKMGEKVEFKGGMEMTNFKSKTLKRTFKKIMFFTFIRKEGTSSVSPTIQSMLPKGHRPIGKELNKMELKKKNISIKAGSIKKADGGLTVEDCYKNRKSLGGKKIVIRGIIIKFSKNIMGKNWIHLQDGTGKDGTDDLTVTTKMIALPGDLVLLKGILAVDKDFGAGYKYSVILENAEIKVEKRGSK